MSRRAAWLAHRWWGVIGAAAVTAVIWQLPAATVAWLHSAVLAPAVFWAAAAFIALYSAMAPWWRNEIGRVIVSLDFALAVLLLHDVLAQFGLPLSAASVERLRLTALVITLATILDRTWLLARVHGWAARFPWRHPDSLRAPWSADEDNPDGRAPRTPATTGG